MHPRGGGCAKFKFTLEVPVYLHLWGLSQTSQTHGWAPLPTPCLP